MRWREHFIEKCVVAKKRKKLNFNLMWFKPDLMS